VFLFDQKRHVIHPFLHCVVFKDQMLQGICELISFLSSQIPVQLSLGLSITLTSLIEAVVRLV